MKVLIITVLCLLGVISNIEAAGRAFPIASENFVQDLFKDRYNLKWDESNFLVDLAGKYTGCEEITNRRGRFEVPRMSREGNQIVGIQDYGPSRGNDVGSVAASIEDIVKPWTRDFDYLLNTASLGGEFGCSVRPGCSNGMAHVVCLFTGLGQGQQPEPTANPIIRPVARAFTEDQYKVTERILYMGWDRSHYLENMAGSVTKCTMDQLGRSSKDLRKIEEIASRHENTNVIARYGQARNLGQTEPAMVNILKSFKKDQDYFQDLGCALIADCMYGSDMYVLVTCLFAE